MHVVVIGAGAVGTLYGGWLLAGGADVSFVARGRRLETLQRNGILLRGAGPSWRREAIRASDAIERLPQAHAILIATKLYDLEEAAATAKKGLAAHGLVVGLQNGVSAADMLAPHFPPGQIMVGPVYSAATLNDDGAVDYAGNRNLVAIGSPTGASHPLATTLVDHWRAAGVEALVSDDIRRVLWTKFLVFGTNAALTCLSRQPAGVVYHDPDLLALAEQSVCEILAVARAEGVDLPDSAVGEALDLLRGMPFDLVASMRQDLDAGRRHAGGCRSAAASPAAVRAPRS
jgi:2-dehydropantoate 2-reductase